jgi:hypothetical protein
MEIGPRASHDLGLRGRIALPGSACDITPVLKAMVSILRAGFTSHETGARGSLWRLTNMYPRRTPGRYIHDQ